MLGPTRAILRLVCSCRWQLQLSKTLATHLGQHHPKGLRSKTWPQRVRHQETATAAVCPVTGCEGVHACACLGIIRFKAGLF